MKMGRGTFYLMMAEVVFVLSGWIIHIGAGRILGEELYGIFVILLSLLTLYRVFLATGVNRAVSKYIAENPARQRAVQRQALKLQLGLGLFLFAVVWFSAPLLSRWWQNQKLIGYIRLTAFFLPLFGIYSVYRGSLNGLKLFGKEARVSIIYSLLKVIFLFILIFTIGERIYGAVTGYLIAVIGALFLARFSCPPPRTFREEKFPPMTIIRFAFPVVLFSFIVSLIQHIDLYFVQALLPADEIKQASSYYGCAQQFAKIPYMLLYALSLTLFPNIASSTSEVGKEYLTGGMIRKALRGGLLIALPTACLISADAPALIDWIFPRISGGGEALRLLIFGQMFLAFLLVLTTVLTASGRPWLSFVLVALTLAGDAVLNYLLVPSHGILGAAAATTIAAGAGLFATAFWVLRYFRTLLPPSSFVKIAVASLLLYGAATGIAPEGLLIPPVFLLLSGAYLLLLFTAREIDSDDWKMLKSLFTREKPAPPFGPVDG